MQQSNRAFLFDLDGTLIDNMEYHIQAWQELFADMGYHWSLPEVKLKVYGKNQEMFPRIFGNKYTQEEMDAFILQKEKRYLDLYGPKINFIAGVTDFVAAAKEANIKLGIATAGPKIIVDFAIEALNLYHYFDTIVHGDMVKQSKPHAETYLTTAALLQTEINNCLVFEDAPVGVASAANAGMSAIVVLSTHQKIEFEPFANVQGFINDYTHITVSDGLKWIAANN